MSCSRRLYPHAPRRSFNSCSSNGCGPPRSNHWRLLRLRQLRLRHSMAVPRARFFNRMSGVCSRGSKAYHALLYPLRGKVGRTKPTLPRRPRGRLSGAIVEGVRRLLGTADLRAPRHPIGKNNRGRLRVLRHRPRSDSRFSSTARCPRVFRRRTIPAHLTAHAANLRHRRECMTTAGSSGGPSVPEPTSRSPSVTAGPAAGWQVAASRGRRAMAGQPSMYGHPSCWR
mmetsp:Transcript_8053/g.23882  ORF Transcript_8053/g.23882 Transcript_8053/m.23882 type:complete len:227 (-) Transcript_8053:5878-6558(-)